MNYNNDTLTMAENLNKLAGGNEQGQTVEAIEQALYNIKAIAENPYNSDYWRTLWQALTVVLDQ